MSKTIRKLTRSIGDALGLDVLADAVRSARELLAGQPARVPVPVRVRHDPPRPRGGRGRRG